jgi:hypothetical protein
MYLENCGKVFKFLPTLKNEIEEGARTLGCYAEYRRLLIVDVSEQYAIPTFFREEIPPLNVDF